MNQEKEWILQSQNGNRDAFCALMETHQSRIYALCFRYMRNEHDASDAAQESILKAYLNISKFRFDSAFSTWVYRITVNTCLDMLRRRRNTAPIEEFGRVSAYANPEQDTLYAEFRAGVIKAVDALPNKFKNVVVLKDMEHKKYEEIADILGISVGTVKSRLARAREKLIKMLQSEHLM